MIDQSFLWLLARGAGSAKVNLRRRIQVLVIVAAIEGVHARLFHHLRAKVVLLSLVARRVLLLRL